MKYIDIQLTDKELWQQFQAKYQAGEYADALSLLQTLTPNSKAYVWEKYNISQYYENDIKLYRRTSTKNPAVPPDADTSVKYTVFNLDSETGEYTLSEPGDGTFPYYCVTSSSNKIYRFSQAVTVLPNVNIYKTTTDTYTSVLANKQGETCYGTVTSEDETTYPANGEQDGYWYVLVSETAEGGYKGLIAKALNALTDYIVRVENLNDSTFKADRLPVQANQPTQTTGQMWFQVTN